MQSDLTTVPRLLSEQRTICAVVDYWSEVHCDHPAIEYLPESGAKITLDYRDLRDRAIRVANQLGRVCEPGDRVVMILPPGPDFIVGFLGCLYAGVLAVPATEPKPRRLNDRLARVARDCSPSVVLATGPVAERIDPSVVCPPLADLPWIIQDDNYEAPGHRLADVLAKPSREVFKDDDAGDQVASAIAFLQYTSGSTSDPVGVAVSHQNLLHNLEMIRVSFGQQFNHQSDRSLRGLFWLPPYHDMGLIGGILTPLYLGGTAVLMPPTTFLKRPLSWLQAISDERALISGAPNFAYDLCVTKIAAEDRKRLDLSSWEIAFCGAEPIRAETIDRFCDTFAASGFSRQSFYPCYGLAEATLLVSGNLGRREPVIKTIDRRELEQHRAVDIASTTDDEASENRVQVVGCGAAVLDGEIVIVHPETRMPVESNEIGEIWYRGANVACGYWNHPEKSASVFSAQLASRPGVPFLRTGDSGFIDGDQLFITGRLKEMLVIRGRNFYPQDLESTARSVDSNMMGGAIAFATATTSGEGLVIALEVDRQVDASDFGQLIRNVRSLLTEVHEVSPETIVLVRPFSLPRTTSGKMQRLLAKQMFSQDQLKTLSRWDRSIPTDPVADNADSNSLQAHSTEPLDRSGLRSLDTVTLETPLGASLTDALYQPLGDGRLSHLAEEIERWLCSRLVRHGALAPEEVTPDRPLAEYGLDSMATLQLAGEIEDHYKIALNPIAMWNYPTARHLSSYLAEQIVGEFGEAYSSEDETIPTRSFESLLREIELMDDNEVRRRLGGL